MYSKCFYNLYEVIRPIFSFLYELQFFIILQHYYFILKSQSFGYCLFKIKYHSIQRKFNSPLGLTGAFISFIIFGFGVVSVIFFQKDYNSIIFYAIICSIALIYYFLIAKHKQIYSDDEQKTIFILRRLQAKESNMRKLNNFPSRMAYIASQVGLFNNESQRKGESSFDIEMSSTKTNAYKDEINFEAVGYVDNFIFKIDQISNSDQIESSRPFLIRMPKVDRVQDLDQISNKSFFLPFIIAGFPSELQKELTQLPLFTTEVNRDSNNFFGGIGRIKSDEELSTISFISHCSWSSLGTIWVNSMNPNKEKFWEKRILFSCDNYIFEMCPTTNKIIGFANLCEAQLSFDSMSSFTNSINGSSSDLTNLSSETEILSVSCLFNCSSLGDRIKFWIKHDDRLYLQKLYDKLEISSKLQVESIIDLLSGEEGLLGKGIIK